jgi:hypothetical protein
VIVAKSAMYQKMKLMIGCLRVGVEQMLTLLELSA